MNSLLAVAMFVPVVGVPLGLVLAREPRRRPASFDAIAVCSALLEQTMEVDHQHVRMSERVQGKSATRPRRAGLLRLAKRLWIAGVHIGLLACLGYLMRDQLAKVLQTPPGGTAQVAQPQALNVKQVIADSVSAEQPPADAGVPPAATPLFSVAPEADGEPLHPNAMPVVKSEGAPKAAKPNGDDATPAPPAGASATPASVKATQTTDQHAPPPSPPAPPAASSEEPPLSVVWPADEAGLAAATASLDAIVYAMDANGGITGRLVPSASGTFTPEMVDPTQVASLSARTVRAIDRLQLPSTLQQYARLCIVLPVETDVAWQGLRRQTLGQQALDHRAVVQGTLRVVGGRWVLTDIHIVR